MGNDDVKEQEGPENAEEKKRVTAEEVLYFAFSLIEEKTWISLGLLKDSDDEFHKSKEDSRLLIDTLSRMLEAFGSKLDEKNLKEMGNHVSTLQMNFVNQFK